MTMPIQTQSQQYGAFDDGLRFGREERATHELPEGLAHMLGGPRITAGLNNPGNRRTAGPELPTYDMVSGRPDDDAHSQAAERYYRQQEMGPGHPPSEEHLHDPGFSEASPSPHPADHPAGFGFGGYDDYDPHSVENLPPDYGEQFGPHMASFTSARTHIAEDGPAPGPGGPGGPGLFNPLMFQPRAPSPDSMMLGGEKAFINDQPMAQPAVQGVDWLTAGYDPTQTTEFISDPRQVSQPDRDDLRLRDYGPVDWSYQNHPAYNPHDADDTYFLKNDAGKIQIGDEDYQSSPNIHLNKQAAAVQPQVVPGWVGHGYAPGHRIGLPWREQVIPGTVTHLDGQQVGVRWDDGQHSTEEPKDLRPL